MLREKSYQIRLILIRDCFHRKLQLWSANINSVICSNIMHTICMSPQYTNNYESLNSNKLICCFIFSMTLKQTESNQAMSLIAHWLCYVNSAVNPIIYNFMSGKFSISKINFCSYDIPNEIVKITKIVNLVIM